MFPSSWLPRYKYHHAQPTAQTRPIASPLHCHSILAKMNEIDRALDDIIREVGRGTKSRQDRGRTAASSASPFGGGNTSTQPWNNNEQWWSNYTLNWGADPPHGVSGGGDPMDVDDADPPEDVDMVDVHVSKEVDMVDVDNLEHDLLLDVMHTGIPAEYGDKFTMPMPKPPPRTLWSPALASPTFDGAWAIRSLEWDRYSPPVPQPPLNTTDNNSTTPSPQPEQGLAEHTSLEQVRIWAQHFVAEPLSDHFRSQLALAHTSQGEGVFGSILSMEEALNNCAFCLDLVGLPGLAQAYRLRLEELVLLRCRARMGDASEGFVEMAQRWRETLGISSWTGIDAYLVKVN